MINMITGDNALFLLLQMFSSGVAGYITNKYAVNMIFKEYTPLKIGGAVKKNKEKFISCTKKGTISVPFYYILHKISIASLFRRHFSCSFR